MRRFASLLFLLAMAAIALYVVKAYRDRIAEQKRRAPAAPDSLPQQVHATASDWTWEKSSGDGPAVSVKARHFRQIREPDQFELEGLELRIYRKDGKTYDYVRSDRAVFDLAEATLFSEGEAQIIMGVPEGEEPVAGRLIEVRAHGIRFDSRTAKAETEREAFFHFDRGEGRSVGAVYDPTTRELLLKSRVELTWYGENKSASRPMKVEAGQALYKEGESKVILSPWSRFSRGGLRLNGSTAVVAVDAHGIRRVDAAQAKGSDQQRDRRLEFQAPELVLYLDNKSVIEAVEGSGGARFSSVNEHGETRAAAGRVRLEFDAVEGESLLRRVLAANQAVVESVPGGRAEDRRAQTRILRSEEVTLQMRAGGREVESIDTATPAVLELLPRLASQRRRRVEGEKFHIEYGSDNQLRMFQALEAKTQTEAPLDQGKPSPPQLTQSKQLVARFAAKTADLTWLEQSGDFRYQEGRRRAQAVRAVLESDMERITLYERARVWDEQGATSADTIMLDQKSRDFQASGQVSSSRLPEGTGSGTAILSPNEPLQAQAARMTTRQGQQIILYEGGAVLWQGANRLHAERIEIDRKNGVLKADGKVLSRFLDQQIGSSLKGNGQGQTTVPTSIEAPALIYTAKDRVAHYRGGVALRRPGMELRSQELRAYFREQAKDGAPEGQRNLEWARAEGDVRILETRAARQRRGSADQADYWPDEDKVVLNGSPAEFRDSVKGVTRGQRLIYYSKEDRLLVEGAAAQPAESRIRRK